MMMNPEDITTAKELWAYILEKRPSTKEIEELVKQLDAQETVRFNSMLGALTVLFKRIVKSARG